VAIAFLALIQFVPYGRDHDNPPITSEPNWDQVRTRELFLRACKDCHSNQTEWPWYSSVAPASWLVRRDVTEGQSHFNVSEWGRDENHGDEGAELVRKGDMPPWFYLPAHPEARLSDGEREELAAGLDSTFGKKRDDGHSDHDHDH
jgi:mono/diheme cytochrome c family protein